MACRALVGAGGVAQGPRAAAPRRALRQALLGAAPCQWPWRGAGGGAQRQRLARRELSDGASPPPPPSAAAAAAGGTAGGPAGGPPGPAVGRLVDFEAVEPRRHTGSVKYDRFSERGSGEGPPRYRDVLPMWVADMEFRSPRCVVDALHARVEAGVYGYTSADWRVKGAVLRYLAQRHGLGWLGAQQLLFLPGLVVGLNLVARMAARRGQPVVTLTPVYPPFMTCAKNAGTVSVAVPLRAAAGGGWSADLAALEAAVPGSEPGGVLLLCSPHNPVGKVFSRDELLELVRFARSRNLVVVSDEIHCELLLDEASHPFVPTLALADGAHDDGLSEWLRDNIIVFHAPSKTFNLAGLCAAFAVVPGAKLRARFKSEMAGIAADVSPFGYEAMRVAYEDPARECSDYRARLIQHIRDNVDALAAAAASRWSPLIKFDRAAHRATYLCWLDARQLAARLRASSSDTTLTRWVEADAGLGLNDGQTFGPGDQYAGFLRINLACPKATLQQAIERLDHALAKLPPCAA
jgi:cystathionine beta-lyase